MKKILFLVVFVLSSIAVFAGPMKSSDLKDKKFSLESNDKITIGFAAGNRVFGFGGINRFMGSYSLADGTITFGELSITTKSGTEEEMQKETEFVQKIQKQTLPISLKKGKLEIGDLIFIESKDK